MASPKSGGGGGGDRGGGGLGGGLGTSSARSSVDHVHLRRTPSSLKMYPGSTFSSNLSGGELGHGDVGGPISPWSARGGGGGGSGATTRRARFADQRGNNDSSSSDDDDGKDNKDSKKSRNTVHLDMEDGRDPFEKFNSNDGQVVANAMTMLTNLGRRQSQRVGQKAMQWVGLSSTRAARNTLRKCWQEVADSGGHAKGSFAAALLRTPASERNSNFVVAEGEGLDDTNVRPVALTQDMELDTVRSAIARKFHVYVEQRRVVEAGVESVMYQRVDPIVLAVDAYFDSRMRACALAAGADSDMPFEKALEHTIVAALGREKVARALMPKPRRSTAKSKMKRQPLSKQPTLKLVSADVDATLTHRHAAYPERRREVDSDEMWRRVARPEPLNYAHLVQRHATRLGSERVIAANTIGGGSSDATALGKSALCVNNHMDPETAASTLNSLAADGGLVLWELACDGGWGLRLRVAQLSNERERRTHAISAARQKSHWPLGAFCDYNASTTYPDHLVHRKARSFFDHSFVFATDDVGHATRRSLLYLAASDAAEARHAGVCAGSWLGYKAWSASWWESAAKRAEKEGRMKDASNLRRSFALRHRGTFRCALSQLISDGYLESTFAMGIRELRIASSGPEGKLEAMPNLLALSMCLSSVLAAGDELCGAASRLLSTDSRFANGASLGPGHLGLAGGAYGYRVMALMCALDADTEQLQNDSATRHSEKRLRQHNVDTYRTASFASRTLASILCGTRRHFLTDELREGSLPTFDMCVSGIRGEEARKLLAHTSHGPGLNALMSPSLRSPYAAVRKSLADVIAIHSQTAEDRSYLLVEDTLIDPDGLLKIQGVPRKAIASFSIPAPRAPVSMVHALVEEMHCALVDCEYRDDVPPEEHFNVQFGSGDLASQSPKVQLGALAVTQACGIWGCTVAGAENWRAQLSNSDRVHFDSSSVGSMEGGDAADANDVFHHHYATETKGALRIDPITTSRFMDVDHMKMLLSTLSILSSSSCSLDVRTQNMCAHHVLGSFAALFSAAGHPTLYELFALEPEHVFLKVLNTDEMDVTSKALAALVLANSTAELSRLEELTRLAGLRRMKDHGKTLSDILREKSQNMYFDSHWRTRAGTLIEDGLLATTLRCSVSLSRQDNDASGETHWIHLLRDSTACCCFNLMNTSLAMLSSSRSLQPKDKDVAEERRVLCHMLFIDDRPRVVARLAASIWGSLRSAPNSDTSGIADSWLNAGAGYTLSNALKRIVDSLDSMQGDFDNEAPSTSLFEHVDAAAWIAASIHSIARSRHRKFPIFAETSESANVPNNSEPPQESNGNEIQPLEESNDVAIEDSTEYAHLSNDDDFVSDDGGLIHAVKPLSAILRIASTRRHSSGQAETDAVDSSFNQLVHASACALECLFSVRMDEASINMHDTDDKTLNRYTAWLVDHVRRNVEFATAIDLPKSLLTLCGADPEETDTTKLIARDADDMRHYAKSEGIPSTGVHICWHDFLVQRSVAMGSAARCYFALISGWGGLDAVFYDPPKLECALPPQGRAPLSAYNAVRLAVILSHSKFRAKQHVGLLLAAHISGTAGPVGAYCRHVMVAVPENYAQSAHSWQKQNGGLMPLLQILNEEAELASDGDADEIFKKGGESKDRDVKLADESGASFGPDERIILVATGLVSDDAQYTPTRLDDESTTSDMYDPSRRRRYRLYALQALANLVSVECERRRACDSLEAQDANASDIVKLHDDHVSLLDQDGTPGESSDNGVRSIRTTAVTSHEFVARIILVNHLKSLDNIFKVVRRSVRSIDVVLDRATVPSSGSAPSALDDERFDSYENTKLRWLLCHTIEASRQCAEMLTSIAHWPHARTPLYRSQIAIASAISKKTRGDASAKEYFVDRFDTLFFDPPILTTTKAWEHAVSKQDDPSADADTPFEQNGDAPDAKAPAQSAWGWAYGPDRLRYREKHLEDIGGAGRLRPHRPHRGGQSANVPAQAHSKPRPASSRVGTKKASFYHAKQRPSSAASPTMHRTGQRAYRRGERGVYLTTESAPPKIGRVEDFTRSSRRPHSSLATAPQPQRSETPAFSLPRQGHPFSTSESSIGKLGTPASASTRRFLRFEASLSDLNDARRNSEAEITTASRPPRPSSRASLPKSFDTPLYEARRGGSARKPAVYSVPGSVPTASQSPCGYVDWSLPESIQRINEVRRSASARKVSSRFMDWDREQFESRLNAADSEDAKVKVYLRRKQAHHRPDGVPLLESPSIMSRRYSSAKVAQSASATKSCIDSFISQGSLDDDELLYELEYGARSLDARHSHSFTDTPSQGSDVDDGIDNDQLRDVELQPGYDDRSDGAHRIGPIPDKARGDVATLLQSLRERRSKLWAPNMAMQFSASEAASNVRDSRSSAGGRTHPAPPTALDRRLTNEEVLEMYDESKLALPTAFPEATFGCALLDALDAMANANGYFLSHGHRWTSSFDMELPYPSHSATYEKLIDRRRPLVAPNLPSRNATYRRGGTGAMEYFPKNDLGDVSTGVPNCSDISRALDNFESGMRRLAEWPFSGAEDGGVIPSTQQHDNGSIDEIRERHAISPRGGDALLDREVGARVRIEPGRPGDTVCYKIEPALADDVKTADVEHKDDYTKSSGAKHATTTSHSVDLFESVKGSKVGPRLAPSYSMGDNANANVHYFRRKGRLPPPLALTWNVLSDALFSEQQLLRRRMHPINDVCNFAPVDPCVQEALNVLPPPRPLDEVVFVPLPLLPYECENAVRTLDASEPGWEKQAESDALRIMQPPDDRVSDTMEDRWRHPGRIVDAHCRLDFEARCVLEVEDVDHTTRKRNEWRIENSVFAPRPIECAAHAYLDFHYYPARPMWIGFPKLVCNPKLSYVAFEADWQRCVSKTRFTRHLTEVVHADIAFTHPNLVHDDPEAFELEFASRLKQIRLAARELHPRLWAAFDYYRVSEGSGDDGTITLNEYTSLCDDARIGKGDGGGMKITRDALDRIFNLVNVEEGGKTTDAGLERREFFDAMLRVGLLCSSGRRSDNTYVTADDGLRDFGKQYLSAMLPAAAQPHWYLDECASHRGEILLALPAFQPKPEDNQLPQRTTQSYPRSRASSVYSVAESEILSDDELDTSDGGPPPIEALDQSKHLHVDGREVSGAAVLEGQALASHSVDRDDDSVLPALCATNDYFRANRLYNPEVDRLLKKRYRLLRTLFHTYVERAPEMALLSSAMTSVENLEMQTKVPTGRLGMKAWDMLLRDASILRLATFGRREAYLAFLCSIAAVPDVGGDEINGAAVRNRSLTFTGFLEALGRVSEILALPRREDLQVWAFNAGVDLKDGERANIYDYCAAVSSGWGYGNGCAMRDSQGAMRASRRHLSEKLGLFLDLVAEGLRRKLDVRASALEMDQWRREPVHADNALADALAAQYLSAQHRSILRDALAPNCAPGTKRYRLRPSIALHAPIADRMVVPAAVIDRPSQRSEQKGGANAVDELAYSLKARSLVD
ncbi:spatacsin C-terminal domain-containing protein [Pseudoscourfieldia marina]